jgi:hypothetical protein
MALIAAIWLLMSMISTPRKLQNSSDGDQPTSHFALQSGSWISNIKLVRIRLVQRRFCKGVLVKS